MPPKMFDIHRQISADELAATEKALGRAFPDDYRRFALKYNGGRPEPDGFTIRWDGQDWADGWDTDTVAWFVSFHPGGLTDFLKYHRNYKDRIPADMVPIAHDPGGNLILLAVDGRDRGRVYFWMQDYEVAEGETPDRSNVGFVADSFDVFFDSLH